MKSIFFGYDTMIRRVYTPEIMVQLTAEAGLHADHIYFYSDLSGKKEDLAEVRFIFTTWGMLSLSEDEIAEKFPRLEAIFYAAGSVQDFAKPFMNCGVRIFSAWQANAVPVAEYTSAQILLANKSFFACSRLQSNGMLDEAHQLAGQIVGNYNTKVGIIGAGMIGTMVIKLLQHHKLQILVFDPFLSDERAQELGVEKVSLETLFKECQVVSNHLANNKQTEGMLQYKHFASLPSGGVFINTGRGAQVVEADLVKAMSERSDLTALLDVTYPEPPEQGHPFYTLPNVVLTPHIAGSMGREVERMGLYMLEEYRRFEKGEPCLYEVTENMLSTMA